MSEIIKSLTWILVTNASHARLFASHILGKDLKLIKSFKHTESREKDHELVSDRQGRYQKNMSQESGLKGAYQEPTDPHALEAMRFASHLTDCLENERARNKFDRLIVISLPRFLGYLKTHFTPGIEEKIINYIEKDYTQLDEKALNQFLDELPRF